METPGMIADWRQVRAVDWLGKKKNNKTLEETDWEWMGNGTKRTGNQTQHLHKNTKYKQSTKTQKDKDLNWQGTELKKKQNTET